MLDWLLGYLFASSTRDDGDNDLLCEAADLLEEARKQIFRNKDNADLCDKIDRFLADNFEEDKE